MSAPSVYARLADLLPVCALGLLLAQPAVAAFDQDQFLSLGDFSADVPQNTPDLQFGDALAFSGNWMAVGAPGGNAADGQVWIYERVSGGWVYRTRLTAPVSSPGADFGAAVDVYEAGGLLTVIVGAPLHDGPQADQGRAYVFSDIDPAAGFNFVTATIDATSAEVNGHFGAAVALYADAAAIGAPGVGAGDAGQVSIRARNTGGAQQWGAVTVRNGDPGERFGTALDLHGEYLAVGAPLGVNPGAIATGRVVVFRQDLGGANQWGLKHSLFPATTQAGQWFGFAAGIWDSNLGTADSVNHAVVGAPLFDGASNADLGAVTLFVDTTVSLTNVVTDNTFNAGANHGYSVAIEGALALAGRPAQTISAQPQVGQVNTYRYNGTVWQTNTINLARTGAEPHDLYGHAVDVSNQVAVIGAPGARVSALEQPPGAARAGGVSTLVLSGVTFAVEQPELVARFEQPNMASSQFFGFAVDMTADWMAVGVSRDGQKGAGAGAVQMYRRVGGVWTPHSRLTGLYTRPGDGFGASVSLSGTRLVVGAPNFDGFTGNVSNSGAVHLYQFNGAQWVQVVERAAPNPVANGNFGISVALRGDVLVVGATGENGGRGRVYAFRALADLGDPLARDIPAASVSSATGFAVSVYDPAPGTANDEVIAVGAYNENAGQGAAYVLSGATFATTTTLIDPAPGSNRFFGYAVSIHDGRVAVGAPTASPAPSGRVVVYRGPGYATATALTRPTAAGQFGFSLMMADATLVIGAPASNGRAGLAAVFLRSGETWTESGLLQPATLGTFDEAGTSVAMSSGQFVFGAPLHNANGIADSGAAFVFSQAPEVMVSPASLSLSETGPTSGSVLVQLNQAPDANVTVSLSFDSSQIQVDAGSGFGASPQTVTLTPANAVSGVAVQVRAIDDALAEADPHALTITTGPTASSSTRFAGLVVDDITVSVADNDVAGVLLTQSGGSTAVDENGLTDTYTLVLTSQPAGTVNVSISFPVGEVAVNGDLDGVYNTSFTTGNWNVAQTLTVAAVNDRNFESGHAASLVHAFASSDPAYQGITASIDGAATSNVLDVAIADNESAQLRWVSASGSGTEGLSYSQNVELSIAANPVGGAPLSELPLAFTASPVFSASAEAADVQVQFTGQTIAAGSPSGAVVAVQHQLLADTLVEGPESFVLPITLNAPPAGLSAGADHSATILDANTATLALTGGTTVAEAVGSTPLLLTLQTSSGATLEQGLSATLNLSDGTAVYGTGTGDYALTGPANSISVNFAAGSGNGATQSVPVLIRNDALVEGTESFTAALGGVSGAATVTGAAQTLTIIDNDLASIGFAAASSQAPEAVSPHLVQAVLSISADGTGTPQLQGAASVATVATAGTAVTPADYTLDNAALAFPAGSTAGTQQAFTLTIVDDLITEGDESLSLSFGSVTGPLTASGTHAVAIADNDLPGVTVLQSDGSTDVAEGGSGDSYTVVLDSQPAADVSLNLSGTQVSVAPATLSFTPANWNQAQTVTVNAIDDAVAEGSHSGAVGTVVSSSDSAYSGLPVAPLAVSIADNDSAGFSVAQSAGTTVVTEGGATDSYTIALTSEPTATVTLSLSGTQVTAAPATLSFTAADWNIAQTVTVSAIDDAVAEGNHSGSVNATVSSSDATYAALGVAAIAVSISDNDFAGVRIIEAGGGTVATEGGVSGSYTVQLLSEPTAIVTLTLSGSQVGTTPTALSFTAANWNQPQTVTVSALDDNAVEGPHNGLVTSTLSSADGLYNAVPVPAVSVAITDNDFAGLSISDASMLEGPTGTATLSFSVSLNVNVPAPFTVSWSTLDDTAVAPGDYTSASGTLSFSGTAGEMQTLLVTVNGDAIVETDEQFRIQLGTPSSAQVTLNDGQASGTLDNDDTATLSAAAVLAAEGDAGTTNFSFVLSLNGQVQDGFSVQAATRDASATAGSDYNSSTVTVSFDGGANANRTVLVGVIGDEIPEALERFWVDLASSQPDLSILTPSVSADIVNDDLDADLRVTNNLVPGAIVKGGTVEFQVRVDNLSAFVDVPAATVGFALSDTLEPLDWTCVADPGASCPASGSGVPAHSIALAAGSGVSYRIRAQVLSAGEPDEVLTGTATVTVDSPYSDPNPTNNTASSGTGQINAVFKDGFESP